MKYSALVLVFLCLGNTHLCGRLNLKTKIGKRLTPHRLPGIDRLFRAVKRGNQLFRAFPRGKFIRPSELPANRQGLKQFGQEASSKAQDEAARKGPPPALVIAMAAGAATVAAAIGAGIGVDWDMERLRVGMQNVRGAEGVPSLWEFAVSGKSEEQALGSSLHPPVPPPPPPQEEEKDSPSQPQHDEELPPPGNWAKADGSFSIATDMAFPWRSQSSQTFVSEDGFIGQQIFKYTGDFGFQEGQRSDVAYVVREDGQRLIMKRPKYTERNWEDNLQKECFVARYLNLVGAANGVVDCIGERIFEPHEVAALKASQKKIHNEVEYDNKEKWHAILLEQVEGKSFLNTALSLSKAGRKDSDTLAVETKAVEQIIRTTGQMLKAGIVNVDQWHNILVNDEGEAKFIDLEGANFLTDAPLQKFLADAGKEFKHEKREMEMSEGFGPVGKWQVTQNAPPKVLNKDEAERKVRRMVTHIFCLVPPHAVLAAEETLKSRERLGNSLDDIVDEAWAARKATLHLTGLKDILGKAPPNSEKRLVWLDDKVNIKSELPPKAQEDHSRPPGYEHHLKNLHRYAFNGSPTEVNPKAELPPKAQEDFSGPSGYQHHSKDLHRYEFNDSPTEVNIKGGLPPEAQEDYSRPPGYEHHSKSLHRYELNDSPTDYSAPAGDQEPHRHAPLPHDPASP